MEHVGAITADETAAWRRRLHEAAAWQEQAADESPSAQVAARAADHLERVLAPVAPGTHEESIACFSAIAAYAQTGILTAEEALGWRERVRAQLGMEPERSPLLLARPR